MTIPTGMPLREAMEVELFNERNKFCQSLALPPCVSTGDDGNWIPMLAEIYYNPLILNCRLCREI